MGVELDRKRAREKEWEAGGGAKALLLTREDMAKEKAVVDGAAQLERRDLRQVEEDGRSKGFWRGEGGASLSSGPSYTPEPSGISRQYGWKSCSKS